MRAATMWMTMLMSMAGCLELEPLPPVVDAALDGGRDARLTGDGGAPDTDPPDRGRMDAGPVMDAMPTIDAGPLMDAAPLRDAMPIVDAGLAVDATPLMDAMLADMIPRAVDMGVGCGENGPCPVPADSCQVNSCVDGLCVRTIKVNGEVCDDGLACTVDDTCTDGVCGGMRRDCPVGECEEQGGCPGECMDDADCSLPEGGGCHYNGECASMGIRSEGACVNGACVVRRVEEGCVRETDGIACAAGGVCESGDCVDVEE